jgi:hypothetical protein
MFCAGLKWLMQVYCVSIKQPNGAGMLPLNDDRWQQLTTFFREPKDIPKILEEWLASVEFDQNESKIYQDDLFDIFLHQTTITNVAFAIVPWLVHVCRTRDTRFRAIYLTDVALVEALRITYGVHSNREGTEKYPDWLMSDYTQAIAEACTFVDDVIEAELDEDRKRFLVALKPALFGNADLAWSQW